MADGSRSTSLTAAAIQSILTRLQQANAALAARYPDETGERQAVHTVYGGAHLFRADSAARLGKLALEFLDQYAPDPMSFARALHFRGWEALPSTPAEIKAVERELIQEGPSARAKHPAAWFAHTVYRRVREKLRREPVEDFRLDFEDGYGNRPDEEEDACAVSAAGEVAKGMEAKTLPPFIGIRIKPLSRELFKRGVRTLDIFFTTLVDRTGGAVPANFVVTLPKVVIPDQVAALATLFERLEDQLGLPAGTLKLEIMVETPQSIISTDGRSPLPELVAAARGRCVAAHFGVYDYTASLTITAEYQRMRHPACDLARQMMQLALAGTGVMLSDGATNVLPVPIHRAPKGGTLTARQVEENRESVFGAWRLHYDDVRHSLTHAYYQGWDLHPAQLPTRYAALYSFFLESLEPASERLRSFVAKAGQATLVGDVFDDAATGQGLLNFFLRGLGCGAITEDEALAAGLTVEELRSRSFVKILAGRRK